MENTWKTQIPTTRDEDGQLWYNCDIMVLPGKEDNVDLSDDDLWLTGNLYLGDNAKLATVHSQSSIFLGDYADTHTLTADDIIIIGDDAWTLDIYSDTGVIIGKTLFIQDDISSVGSITVGTDLRCEGTISALDDIEIGHHSTIKGSLYALCEISIDGHTMVEGTVRSYNCSVEIRQCSRIIGDVEAHLDITISPHVYIQDEVSSNEGNIIINSHTYIEGEVKTSGAGKITICDFVTVDSDISSYYGDIEVEPFAQITRIFSNTGNITIRSNSKVDYAKTEGSITINLPFAHDGAFYAKDGVFMNLPLKDE